MELQSRKTVTLTVLHAFLVPSIKLIAICSSRFPPFDGPFHRGPDSAVPVRRRSVEILSSAPLTRRGRDSELKILLGKTKMRLIIHTYSSTDYPTRGISFSSSN